VRLRLGHCRAACPVSAASVRIRTADGLELAGEEWPGCGRTPVVLLHGGGQTRRAWSASAERLAREGWSTLAVDQRGHGESDWAPDGGYELETFGRDVGAVVDSLAVPPVLVGASLGGTASLLSLGSPAPPDVAALVLVDVAHRFAHQGVERIIEFMRARRDGFSDRHEAIGAVADYLPHRDARPGAQLEHNLREHEGRLYWHWDPALVHGERRLVDLANHREREERIVATLRGLTVPLLLVRGGDSDVITEEIAGEFAALNPGAEVATIPGARHMIAGDANDAFTSAILDFLRRRVPA
jgi:pimeloyl-ACP methyl ester carboxylesterase